MYPLPPPYLLVHADADKTADLYLNYIRIWPVLIDILINGSVFDRSIWRKLREWRIILRSDYYRSTPLPANSTSPFVQYIYDLMPTTSSSTKRKAPHDGMHCVDANDLPQSKKRRVADSTMIKVVFGVEHHLESFDRSKPQIWRGRSVSSTSIQHDKTLRLEVQWELSELLFQYEFYALDHAILPRERMSKIDAQCQNELISTVFDHGGRFANSFHSSTIPDLSKPISDYWDDEPDDVCIQRLADVLQEWPGFAQGKYSIAFKDLIKFYIETFARYFVQMPSMHCAVPVSLAM